MRSIVVPSGIGDFLWLAMKLVNTGEKFDIVIPESKPQRVHQLASLMPYLINSVKFQNGLSYKKINTGNIQNTTKNWKGIKQNSFYLSANRHLEQGKRIETFLPDLDTSYTLDYNTTENDISTAKVFCSGLEDYIGIYCSSYAGSRNWGTWQEKEWFDLITLMGKDYTYVIIGAEWDTDLADKLKHLLGGYNFVCTIGQPLGLVIEVLKRLKYFIGFPSGLSILNETLGKDGLMFYATAIKSIINTWADPERIKNGNIKECLFTEPKIVYQWLKDNNKV